VAEFELAAQRVGGPGFFAARPSLSRLGFVS
jgi:hypothetical protein